MKEFDYYRLLLERLENQEPLDGLKEYEKMKDQTERFENEVLYAAHEGIGTFGVG